MQVVCQLFFIFNIPALTGRLEWAMDIQNTSMISKGASRLQPKLWPHQAYADLREFFLYTSRTAHTRMKWPRQTHRRLGAEFTAHAAVFSLTTGELYCTQHEHVCSHTCISNTVLGLRAQTTRYAGVCAHSLQTMVYKVPTQILAGRVSIPLSHI